jgi:hypothetical protein
MANAQPKTELITQAIDRPIATKLAVSRERGGVAFETMGEVMEFAKLMAVSQQAVPPHCRNQVGICFGIALAATEWGMSPFAVANKSYVVNDRLSYESQLIHAVIEQRAPIQSRLRHEFIGEGAKRRCRVWATAKGETEPLEYTSPETGQITPKNSPLWKTKPDIQLYYNTARDWARVYFPDVILGQYAADELFDAPVVDAPPQGIAALKTKLVPAVAELRLEEAADCIDAPHADADLVQAPPSGPTAEEIADPQYGDQLFEKSPSYE